MLILRVFVEFGTVNPISVAIVRSIGFLELHHLLALHLIVDAYNWLAARCHQLSAVVGVVQTVELLVDGGRIVLDGGETLAGSEVPVLYFSLGVGSGEYVSSFEVVVLGAPEDVREGYFVLVGDGIGEVFLFDVEDLDSTVFAG